MAEKRIITGSGYDKLAERSPVEVGIETPEVTTEYQGERGAPDPTKPPIKK